MHFHFRCKLFGMRWNQVALRLFARIHSPGNMLTQLRIADFCRTPCRRGLFVALVFATLSGALPAQSKKPSAAPNADLARGKYLVEDVAMCVQCHTPRNGDGSLDRSRLLQGAPVIWSPSNGDPNWPLTAPRIGGALPASDTDMLKLLTTGIWTTGQPLRLPMMPFRMTDADAKAVVDYLKSVTPGQ
jgi:mono/diheme cytochrome c family protein